MTATRREVFEALGARSDAAGRTTTTTAALADALDAEEETVADHVTALAACDLARATADGVRVTVTGEELLALDVDDVVVVSE